MRIVHTMLRVANLDRALEFYVGALGMTMFRREDYPTGRFTLAFVGFGDEKSSAVIELTHNWDVTDYDRGTGYGHVAIGVSDVYGVCGRLEAKGVTFVRPVGPMSNASPDRSDVEVIAFVVDPDGYRIEFVGDDM